jgi:hypothetical protein
MPALKPFVPVKSQDQTLTLIQSNLSTALAPALANPLAGGRSIQATFGATYTDTLITHNLGSGAKVRFLVGYTSTPGLSIWVSSKPSPVPAEMIYLQISTVGAQVISLPFGGTPTLSLAPVKLSSPVVVTLFFYNDS